MNDTFGELGAVLSANGYEPVPLQPGQKRPIPAEWQHYRFAPGDEKKWRAAGVGILCGNVVAIDIDVTDEDLAEQITAITQDKLGTAPVRIGKFPKRALIYRTEIPFAKKQTPAYRLKIVPEAAKVEVLGKGQQLVCYGLHPDTGKAYRWNGAGEPQTMPVADLRLVTQDQIDFLLGGLEDLLGEDGEPVVVPVPDIPDAGPRPGLQTPSLIAAVVRGAELHDSLRDLAAHYAAQGLVFKQVCDLLEGIMLAATSEHDDRWKARYADIPRLVHSALEKFKVKAADSGDDLRVEHLPEHWHETRPPARPFILHPFVPRRAVSALVGAGTASKTLLVCEWAVAIMTGTPWREHPALQEGGDVCILTWEDETADYHAKLHSLLNYARPDLLPHAEQIRKRLHIVPMHGSAHRLVAVDERGRPAPTMLPHRVVKLLKAEFPATAQVFIETVSRANAADESNEAFANIIAAGEIIAHETDSGVTAVHHVSKSAAVNGVVDANAGRGGSALADNSRASTVLVLATADMRQSLWPAGFVAADFTDREVVLVENARSSYARKAARVHLERVYPEFGAPYLRAVRAPTQADPARPRRDSDAEKLLAWMQDERRSGQWLAEREIVKRFKEYGLTERAAGNALARAREGGSVVWKDEKQYSDKGRMVTRYRLTGPCDK